MEFKQLRSFVEVVETGSFTKAAERLFVSQPTISTHIRLLEEEFGTRLVLRDGKRVEATVKGLEIFKEARKILNLHDRLLRTCAASKDPVISLGASTIPSAYILPEILPAFGKLYPDIYFNISQNDSQGVIDGLLDGLFDVGLIGMKPERQSLEALPFCLDRMVLITPVSQHFLSYKKEDTFPAEAFRKEPIILRESGSGSLKSADSFLEGLGIDQSDLTVAARINDQEAIKNLVAGGLGISFISERAAKNFILEKRVLAFELPGQAASRELYVVTRKNDILRPEVTDFKKFILRFYN